MTNYFPTFASTLSVNDISEYIISECKNAFNHFWF